MNICNCFLSFLKPGFYMPIIWKSFFDFDMRLSNSSKNDNELILKWNKEKELPMSLKVEFRPLIVKYLVVVLSELIPLMKFSVLEIAGFAIWVNLTCFPMTVCFNSLSLKMLTWYKLLEAKTASTNFTWLYFKTFDSFIFSHFNLNILHSVHLSGIWWFFAINLFSNVMFQTFDYSWKHIPNKLLISLCWQTLH